MAQNLSLFIKILIILILFSAILPYFIDSIIKMLSIEEYNQKPKGNSTFVIKINEEKDKNFKKSLGYIIKNFMNWKNLKDF